MMKIASCHYEVPLLGSKGSLQLCGAPQVRPQQPQGAISTCCAQSCAQSGATCGEGRPELPPWSPQDRMQCAQVLNPAKIWLASLQENRRFADEFRQKLEGIKDRKFQVGGTARQFVAETWTGAKL